jgi:hypothetical protein
VDRKLNQFAEHPKFCPHLAKKQVVIRTFPPLFSAFFNFSLLFLQKQIGLVRDFTEKNLTVKQAASNNNLIVFCE